MNREAFMALVGLARVSTMQRETARQHDALDFICVTVFEAKVSGTLAVADGPGLGQTLEFLYDGDMLVVQEVDRLGRNLPGAWLYSPSNSSEAPRSRCSKASPRVSTPSAAWIAAAT
jgi:DNA invertase Pin-like site-specific DNA recombinase